MPLVGNDQILQMLNDIIVQQKQDNKRIERLETLEFDREGVGYGCIEWLDYVIGGAATLTVTMPDPDAGNPYYYNHLDIFWRLQTYDEATQPLYMRVNGVALGNYYWAYNYSRAGANNPAAAGGATEFFVGRVPPTSQAGYGIGNVRSLFDPTSAYPKIIGAWGSYDGNQAAAARQESGHHSGEYMGAIARPHSFVFFAGAGNIVGQIYLYGWCPHWTDAAGPSD